MKSAAPLQDYSAAAAKFFGDSRTPASIVMGAAISAMFALPRFSSTPGRTVTELFLIKAYRILSWTAFVLSLHVFITCTITSANLLLLVDNYNTMAESALAMLQREFHYQFLSVCWCTIVSMLSFIAIVTIRVTLEFDMFRIPARRDTAKFILCSAGALMASLLSFVNDDVHMNMKDITTGLVRLIVADVRKYTPSFMDIIMVLFVIASVVFAIKSIFFVHPEVTSLQTRTSSSKDKAV
jgi:hypothetical protein